MITFHKSVITLLFCFFIFNSYAASPTVFDLNAAANIDNRIATKNAEINKPIFSVMDYFHAIFVRNTNCWASDLDLTCLSPWNSKGGSLRAGTLITPRHCILAAHFQIQKGDSIRFVTKDNVTVRRKVIAHLINNVNNSSTGGANTYMPDMEIITLDSDVPSTLTPCQFLPANWKNYISNNGYRIPVLYTDQEEKALVADIDYIDYTKLFRTLPPTKTTRWNLNEGVISGDSGNPMFLVLNGKLVLVGCITWGATASETGSGNAATYYANLPDGGTFPELSINDLIVKTDALAGINTGYKITKFDFTAPITAAVEEIESPISAKVFATGRTLKVELNDVEKKTEVKVCDLLGKVIDEQVLENTKYNYELTSSGVYIVNISNGANIKSYKIVVQ
jgi:hypothetical protein